MINEGDFRENVEKIINSSENYTKEELDIAFLEMTERYLNDHDSQSREHNFRRIGRGRCG